MTKKKANKKAAAPDEAAAEETVDTTAVDEAKARVDEAAATLAEAQADHDAAVAEHAAAVEEARVPHDPAEEVGLQLGGGAISYIEHSHPKDAAGEPVFDRTVQHGGKTYEHVAEDVDGCWLYRHLG